MDALGVGTELVAGQRRNDSRPCPVALRESPEDVFSRLTRHGSSNLCPAGGRYRHTSQRMGRFSVLERDRSAYRAGIVFCREDNPRHVLIRDADRRGRGCERIAKL